MFRLGLVGVISLPLLGAAQNPSSIGYDVSTVKPHDPADENMSWRVGRDGFSAINVDLKNVISSAWGVRPDQVTGEPSWVDDLHWDVTAKATDLTPDQLRTLTNEQSGQMMQKLLEERFHLKAHLETRTGSVFTLVPAKGGIKLKPIPMTEEQKATGKVPGSGISISGGRPTIMEAKKIQLSTLISNLALNMHQTVVDKTGLPAGAVYDFTLRWASDLATGPAADSEAPPLPAALQDQLGIHVEAGRGPVLVLVVDHVERPTSN